MDDSYNLSPKMAVRRNGPKLPSLGRHVAQAIGFLILIIFALTTYSLSRGNPKDAIARGKVSLEPLPMPENQLDLTQKQLPDLLEGNVPQNINPTTQLDALGNPLIGPGSDSTSNDLAGGNNTQQSQHAMSISSGPQAIMIDGKPIGGGAFVPQSGLVHAPLPGFSRQTPSGQIPAISPDGRKVVSAYARPFSPVTGKNSVSIIIGGLGIDRNLTRRIIKETPPEVTLSFAAHTNGLQTWINQARDNGHEVLIELPMDSESYNPSEPGASHALMAEKSPAQNIRNLDWLMSRAQGYFAVTNYNGDKIVQRSDIMMPILTHLGNAGLGFIYDGSTPAPSLQTLATSVNLPLAQAYTLIDSKPSAAQIDQELTRLSSAAKAGQTPIGVGFAMPETLAQVKSWVRTLAGQNLQLAPASYALSKS